MGTVTSAGRFALFLILNKSDYNRRNNKYEHGTYDYRSDIGRYPRKHKTQLLSHKYFYFAETLTFSVSFVASL